MDGLIVGFDLCDCYTQISVYNEEGEAEVFFFGDGVETIPTAICKSRRKNEWSIGEGACEMALMGTGIVVDKLLRSVRKGGSATLEDVVYSAGELLELYIRNVLKTVCDRYEKDIKRLVFTLLDLDVTLMNQIMECTKKLGIDRSRVTILSHSECYMYYLLRQNADAYANTSVCVELSKDGMFYYECNIQRGLAPQIAQTTVCEPEDAFSIDILENAQGQKLADSILQPCLLRKFGRKIITSIFFAGQGMGKIQEWGKNTLPAICLRRKVYLDTALFSKGAVWMGVSLEYPDRQNYDYCMIGKGRILAGISMSMQVHGQQKNLILLSAGDRWYDKKGSVEFLLDGEDSLDIEVLPAGTKKPFIKKISLGEMPNRPRKTTRVHMDVEFTSETCLKISVRDMGFGELFSCSGYEMVRELSL